MFGVIEMPPWHVLTRSTVLTWVQSVQWKRGRRACKFYHVTHRFGFVDWTYVTGLLTSLYESLLTAYSRSHYTARSACPSVPCALVELWTACLRLNPVFISITYNCSSQKVQIYFLMYTLYTVSSLRKALHKTFKGDNVQQTSVTLQSQFREMIQKTGLLISIIAIDSDTVGDTFGVSVSVSLILLRESIAIAIGDIFSAVSIIAILESIASVILTKIIALQQIAENNSNSLLRIVLYSPYSVPNSHMVTSLRF